MNARQHRDQEDNRRWGSRCSKERPKRPFRTTVLVFCEGRETEPNYFRSLRAEDNVALSFDVTVKGGKGGSRLQIVQAAVDHIAKTSKRYDQAYLILDTERLDSPEAIKDFGDAMSLAKRNDINTHLSNPSFEVWFLSHFIRTCKHFNDSGSVITELNKHWLKEFRIDYCKTDRSVHRKLKARSMTAIQNARLVREVDHEGKGGTERCNSSTEVYSLVEHLVTAKAV